MISNRFSSLEKELGRVARIVDGKSPPHARPKPAQTTSQATLPKAQLASSSFSPLPAPSRQSTVFNRVDDEEEAFPPLGESSSLSPALDAGRTSGPTRAPAQAVQKFASNRPNIGLSFASVVTEEAMRQQDQAAGHARLARAVQKRNPSGKPKPGHSAAPQGFMDVVVIRRGGCDDLEIEGSVPPPSAGGHSAGRPTRSQCPRSQSPNHPQRKVVGDGGKNWQLRLPIRRGPPPPHHSLVPGPSLRPLPGIGSGMRRPDSRLDLGPVPRRGHR
jgi:hypothetical protein